MKHCLNLNMMVVNPQYSFGPQDYFFPAYPYHYNPYYWGLMAKIGEKEYMQSVTNNTSRHDTIILPNEVKDEGSKDLPVDCNSVDPKSKETEMND